MNESSSHKVASEFRIKSADRMRDLIANLPPTQKAIFLALTVVALVSALVMAYQANQHFLVTVPARGGSLTEGVVGLPRTANPVMAFTEADQDVTALVYAGLLRRDATGALVPDLAKSYTVSPDGLTYDFVLKDALKFDDGTPLTADDVVFTVQKTQDVAIKSPRRADWSTVTVNKISQTEVQFVLKEPYAPFINNATLGIMPQHVWKSILDDQFIFTTYNTQPVGSGPYRVSSVVRDADGVPQSYALAPSSTYGGNKPYIAEIDLRFYQDEARAFEAFRAGEIDSLASADPADAALVASSTATQILTSPVPRLFGVFFNQSANPVLANKEVRQALAMSVDRDAIVAKVLGGYGTAISAPSLAAGAPLVGDNDVSGARTLLEKNGWKIGTDGVYAKTVNKKLQRLSFEITTANSSDIRAAAEMIAAEWRNIGAEVSVNVLEYGDLQGVIAARSYDALFFGEYVGGGQDLYAFWHSSQRNAPGLNVAEYVSSAADKVLADARVATSASRQSTDLSAFATIFAQDVPAVFVYAPDFIYLLPSNVSGADVSGISSPADRWNGVASWYISTDRVWAFFTKIPWLNL